ncbi:MAG TPA: serine hydrolase domain-containing protein [Saprospiraceae bacterium]|nr:serine hydrolase domain-containing protein [Saprospiraceae bacterium]HNT21492.1 serine hydrolase domain-containing protein [Saprospiraceae bacterium]
MIRAVFIAAGFFLSLETIAQTASPTKARMPVLTPINDPALAGMSVQRIERLDKALETMIREQKLPGLVALVARRGKIVLHKAYGLADAPANRSLHKDDIFRIASMTKAITATAVMMLYEEGGFSLDDPIAKWIPAFKNPQVLKAFSPADSSYTSRPASREITIRHLLTHTSGIGYGMIDGDERVKKIYKKAGIIELYSTDPVTTEDNIKRLAALPLHHDPGEKFTYGMGLDVLGYFIEILSKQSFPDFLASRLFQPLGMKDTYFYLPDDKAGRLVKIHLPVKAGTWSTDPDEGYDEDYPIKGARSNCSGGAGLSSTAIDYAIFLQMLLNDGVYNGKRFLSRPTVSLLTRSNQIGDLWGGEEGRDHFSLAFSVLNKKGSELGIGSEGRFSWGGYFNTNYWVDPKEQIVAVLMKQTRGLPEDPSEAVFTRLVYQSIDD